MSAEPERPFASLPVEPDAAADRLSSIVERYWQALRRGEAVSPERWLAECSDDRDEVVKDLRLLGALHDAYQVVEEDTTADLPQGDDGSAAGTLLPRGARLGEVVIEEVLGCGGMGEVYRGRHQELGCPVAVKVMAARLAGDADAVERFRKEVRTLARLKHANIVTALHASSHEGQLYLVMEYVPGTDLKRLVREQGPLPAARACAYLRQVAVGLDYAHRHGIVHRDVKPSNLLLTPDGLVKILDLGLARLPADPSLAGAAGRTGSGLFLGTPNFIAPEQARDAARADARSDLYSLGGTFYFLLTGQPPAGVTPSGPGMVMEVARPRPIREVRPEVPAAVAAVVDRLLAERPEDRYPSAQAVIAALDRALLALSRRRWLEWLVAAAALLVLAAGAAGLWWRLSRPEAAAPALDELVIFIQRQGPDGATQEKQTIIRSGKEANADPIAPLGPRDAFMLRAQFPRPTYWYLLWFDTRGRVKVEKRSRGRQTLMDFPGRNSMSPVAADDPAGMHLLLLVAGALDLDARGIERLEKEMRSVGRPPQQVLPATCSTLHRGAGPPVTPAGRSPADYLQQLGARLPRGLQPVQDLFLPTVK
jgi:hypothetical protein